MKRQLLYYPSIAVPNGPVVRHALLYWDSLLSIVPTDWDGQPQVELTEQMKYLRDEGFYQIASPNDLVVSGGGAVPWICGRFQTVHRRRAC